MRIGLRKSLFPGRAEREIPRHEPLAVRPTADGGRLQLLRSETNPAVRRWRRLGPQVRLHYSERARAVLREAATGNGQVTRRRLEHPDIRELVEHGLITVHEEPAHHAFEYSTRITAAGREYLRRIEANVKRQAKEAQVSMFKGRILLRKAMQIGLFGAKPPAPIEGATTIAHVSAHLAHDPHGAHLVRAHERHVAPAKPKAPAKARATASAKASDDRFANLELEGYYRAGSPDSMEYGHVGEGPVLCVRCGSRIAHVFVTNHGNLGGDCLATLTGDDSTRALARKLNTNLGTWSANRQLVGFKVGTSAHSGATVSGIYRWGDVGENTRILWASDTAPAALVQGIVQQYVEHREGRPLRFVAEIDATHVAAAKARGEARAEAVDAAAQAVMGDARKRAGAQAHADYYKGLLQKRAQLPEGWYLSSSYDTGTGYQPLIVAQSRGSSDDGPAVIAALQVAGLTFDRDTREGLRFKVPPVGVVEEALDPPARGNLADFDPIAFMEELHRTDAPAPPSPLQATQDTIAAAAERLAPGVARSLAMKKWGKVPASLRKALQLGLFGGGAHPDRTPEGVTDVHAHLGTTGAAAAPPSSDFTPAQVREMRGDGLVVYGYLGEKQQGGNPQQRGTGPEYGDTRTVYKIERFFFPQRKGQPHIPPVEVLTRTLQVYGKKHSGKPPFTYTKDTWLNQRDTEGLVEVRAGVGWFSRYTPEAWAPPLPGGTEPRRVYGQRLEGHYTETVPCDARCTSAKGHKCECSCGGANHGTNGVIRTWHERTPAEIKRLLIEHGAPRRPAVLRKAAAAASSGAGPAAKGLRLVASKQNPWVKRWERMEAKPPAEHVRYRHPDTGEERHGIVTSGGAKGITVADHETGHTVRVHHGHYVASETPQASPGPVPAKGKAAPAKGAKAPPKAAPAEPKWREELPGLNKYPPPGVKPDRGGPGDDWKLRWRSPTTGKMVQAYETAYLRDNARGKFDRIRGLASALPAMRRDTAAHLSLHPETEAAVKAAMLRLVDATAMRAGNEDSATKGVHGVSTLLKKHVKVSGDTVSLDYVGKSSIPQQHEVTDPHLAAVVKHLLKLPGDRLFQARTPSGQLEPVTAAKLNDYVRDHLGADHTLKDLRTFHATRLWAEAADRLGPPGEGEDPEEKIKAAAMEVAQHLGHKKASRRAHFAVHKPGQAADHELAAKHGGKVYMHGERRAVGFHTAGELKTYLKASGAEKLHKDDHPEVGEEWLHEPMTSLNNYIDPTVVHAYRKGLTLSGGMRKGTAPGHDGLTPDEARFVDHLEHVRQLDPYKFRGGAP